MNKKIHYIGVLLLVFLPGILFSQKLLVQSNNFEDQNIYKNEIDAKLNTVLSNFTEVLNHSKCPYSSEDIIIQVVFFDPKVIGSLQLSESHSALATYINNWKTKYSSEDRILFYFVKEADEYQLKEFCVTEGLNEGQIPDKVEEYIKKEIVFKNKEDSKEAIYWGVNALKNAFDQRFKTKLISYGAQLLNYEYYYKGYGYVGFDYYYSELNTTTQTGVLSEELFLLQNGDYLSVYLEENATKKALVFDNLIGHPLIASTGGNNININSSNSESLFIRTSASGYIALTEINPTFDKFNLLKFENNTSINSINDISNKDLKEYCQGLIDSRFLKEVVPDGNNKMQEVTTNQLLNINSIYKIYSGRTIHINRGNVGSYQNASQITPPIGWSWNSYRNFSFAQPTWCNMFACDLSKLIYSEVNGDSPVPFGAQGKLANELNTYFKNDQINYINISELRKEEKDEIWSYINKGYPVYFSQYNSAGIGHIETGFPGNSEVTLSNKKYFSNNQGNSNILNTSSAYISIGGGTYSGFKSFDEYSFLSNDNTGVFLFLGYLKIEYN